MQDIGTNEILQAISNLGINLNKRIDNIEKIVGKIPEMQKDIDDMKELVGNIPQMQKDIDDMKELVGNILSRKYSTNAKRHRQYERRYKKFTKVSCSYRS